MAVTTTVQEILDAAFGKSNKNQPGTIATDAVELLELVKRKLQGIYGFAAAIDPKHFSDKEAVTGVGSFWDRPEAAEAVIRIEDSTLAEVVVVPFDDRLAAEPQIALYEFDGGYTASEGQTAPPGGTDVLTFWFAKRPDDPDPFDLSGILDPDWDEAYNELLILEVAIYLAQKDGRTGEVEMLKTERNTWAQLFGSYLGHSTANEQRRFGHKHHVNVESLLPMLTGGA